MGGKKKKSVSSISDLSNVNRRRPTPLPLPLSRSSVGFAAARGPRVRVGHVVVLEARVRCALPLTLTLRGEERVLETHAGGCGLCAHKIYKKKTSSVVAEQSETGVLGHKNIRANQIPICKCTPTQYV